MARKHLMCSEEDFFAASLLMWGTPSREAYSYMDVRVPQAQGVSLWCSLHPDGQRWAAHVQHFGEAKARAPGLYKRYFSWYKKEKKP